MPDEQPPDFSHVREFADRGTLWLLESPENLRGLVEIVAADLVTKLDFGRAERINRSFVPDNLQKQEVDLLYRVPFREGKREVWVYILLEHQSKPDKTMGLRLLSYMVELWRTQMRHFQDAGLPQSKWKLHPVIPIVFYTGNRNWNTPIDLKTLISVPVELERFLPTWETLLLNLKATPSEHLASLSSAMAQVLRVLKVADGSKAELERVLHEATVALDAVFVSSQAEWRRAIYYLYMLLHHKREPDDEADLREELKEAIDNILNAEEGETMARTSAQILLAEGERKGRKEGREEGSNAGRTKLLLSMIEFKFGAITGAQKERVARLSEEQSDEVGLRLLNAQTWNDLGIA